MAQTENDLKQILERLTALEMKAGLAYREEPGYQNYRTERDERLLPESQVFGGNMATSLVTGTGTSAWTTVDLSSLVPNNAEYAQIRFIAEGSPFSTNSAYLEVRRDDQADSATETVAKIAPMGSGWEYEMSVSFKAPMLMGGIRSFEFRINGSGPMTSTTWSFALVGFTTRKRNVADANGRNGTESGETGGSSGGPIFDPVGH